MATEEGIVIAVGPSTARIKTTRSGACKSCASRGSCHTAGGGNDMEVEAINTVGAKVDDRVVINFDSTSLLKVSFLLYIFPILCLLAGALSGQQLAAAFGLDPTAFSVVFGITFFILYLRNEGVRVGRAIVLQLAIAAVALGNSASNPKISQRCLPGWTVNRM